MGHAASSPQDERYAQRKQPPKGSIAFKKLQKQRRKEKKEEEALTPEEKRMLQRLQTALNSLRAESSGGLAWVECEDLKNLVISGHGVDPVAGDRRPNKTSNQATETKQSSTTEPGTRQLYRDERSENTVLRAHNKRLLGEVRRLRATLFTMNIAINNVAAPPAQKLLHELRQRRAGTFSGEDDSKAKVLQQKRLQKLTKKLDRHASRNLMPLGKSLEDDRKWFQYSLPKRVGMILHRDFLQLLAGGHRFSVQDRDRSLSPEPKPESKEAGVDNRVAIHKPKAAQFKLEKHSYARWPLQCGCAAYFSLCEVTLCSPFTSNRLVCAPRRYVLHPVTARALRLAIACATNDRFNIQMLHPNISILTTDLQLFLHRQVHRSVAAVLTHARCSCCPNSALKAGTLHIAQAAGFRISELQNNARTCFFANVGQSKSVRTLQRLGKSSPHHRQQQVGESYQRPSSICRWSSQLHFPCD